MIREAVGRTNWTTDFVVDKPYSSFMLFFTADSTSDPIEAFLKFSDGGNLNVDAQQLQPPLGYGRMFGPFQQVKGKSISPANVRIRANNDPVATGFSYRISVHGCN